MPLSRYHISVTCNIGVGLTITDYLRNNPAVELMILVATIWKIRGIVKATKQTTSQTSKQSLTKGKLDKL